MRSSNIVLACALMICATSTSAAPGARGNPNIILIMADDLGYSDLGSYGQENIETPNLDRMAAEGMRFTNFYAGAPVCAPARSVLMTGLHTGHTTVRGNAGIGGVEGLGGKRGRVPLEDDDVTIAEVMKNAGYVTGMIGKWGLGEPGTSGEPGKQGWDHFYGYLNQRRAHTYYPTYIWKNEKKVVLTGNKKHPKTQYTHDLFADDALAFIRAHHDSPFFLYLPYTIPHAAYEIPSVDPYADMTWSRDEKVHAAMITRMDSDIGEMIALLNELKIADNTIVFFTSDNGAARRWEGRFDSSGALKGQKRSMTECGIRVPMIVRWPSKISAGEVSAAPWWHADLLPTCAALTDAKAPEEIDGVDVSPTLLGEPQDLGGRALYWEFYEGGFKQAARLGDWKAIRPAGKPIQLYDLDTDLGEQHDVASANATIINEFKELFAMSRTPSPHYPTPFDE
jgi:arylsulfatase A-like enzyme